METTLDYYDMYTEGLDMVRTVPFLHDGPIAFIYFRAITYIVPYPA